MGYFFLFLHKNICCGYSLEAPRRGASNEYTQHMFLWRNGENYPRIITKYSSLTSPLNYNDIKTEIIRLNCLSKLETNLEDMLQMRITVIFYDKSGLSDIFEVQWPLSVCAFSQSGQKLYYPLYRFIRYCKLYRFGPNYTLS